MLFFGKTYVLTAIYYTSEYITDTSMEGTPSLAEVVWQRRFVSEKRAQKKAIRRMKRDRDIWQDFETDFELSVFEGDEQKKVVLPKVHLIASSDGPRLLAGRKFSVSYK